MSQDSASARPDILAFRSEQDVVATYRRNYGVGAEIGLDEIRQHAALEGLLTDSLRASAPEARFELFCDAYSRLYAELPWLASAQSGRHYEDWLALLGPGTRILEIGSGAGGLIRCLAERGFDCVGTEISAHRGAALDTDESGVTWHRTDGVHLTDFEEDGAFDHLISDQVFEHLHPDDAATHLATARTLLAEGGSYILRTPHRSAGPHDLSRVFGFDAPVFMHLREYGFAELAEMAAACGYSRTEAVVALPHPGSSRRTVHVSERYLRYNIRLDAFERRLAATADRRRRLRKLAKFLLAPSNVWIRLHK